MGKREREGGREGDKLNFKRGPAEIPLEFKGEGSPVPHELINGSVILL